MCRSTDPDLARNHRNDYAVRWVCLAVVGIGSLAGLRVFGISIVIGSLISQLRWSALFLAFAMAYLLVATKIPRCSVPFAIVSDFLLSVAQILTAMIVLLPLSYLAAMPAFPLLDDRLASLDVLLFRFHWETGAHWVAGYPMFERILEWAYFSFTYQAAAVLLIGSIARPSDRNGEFIWSFGFAAIVTCMVFVFTPALGKVGHVGLAYVQTLTDIRSGQWTSLDYTRPQGIVTFPSFHTAVAILFIYAVRRHLLALAVFVPLNLLLIIATLPIGGHYLVDLPAGAAVAVVSIAAARQVRRRLPVAVGSVHPPEATEWSNLVT